jgi:hypothetical protein
MWGRRGKPILKYFVGVRVTPYLIITKRRMRWLGLQSQISIFSTECQTVRLLLGMVSKYGNTKKHTIWWLVLTRIFNLTVLLSTQAWIDAAWCQKNSIVHIARNLESLEILFRSLERLRNHRHSYCHLYCGTQPSLEGKRDETVSTIPLHDARSRDKG